MLFAPLRVASAQLVASVCFLLTRLSMPPANLDAGCAAASNLLLRALWLTAVMKADCAN